MKKTKFKVGDIVICKFVGNKYVDVVGCGYEAGLIFKITNIGQGMQPCYFGGLDGNGVYETYLESASKPNWKNFLEAKNV